MFREYDIRGKVNDQELNPRTMAQIGQAFAVFLKRSRNINKVVLGHDFRSYSESLKDSVRTGLLSSGCEVTDIGLTLTPMLYFAQYHFNIPGGIMVTASHNPNGWSGLKLADGYSRTLLGGELREIYQIIERGDYRKGVGSVEKKDIAKTYFQAVASRISLKKSIKVVLECGNGTAGKFAPPIFKKIGCEVTELFCNLDSTFPHHNPDPELKEVKEALANKVKEVKADIGISIDGDGDRLGIVDEKGNNIWSDRALILLARQVLERKPGAKIIFDVKCTQALEEDIKTHGGLPIMWKTGHSYIKRKLHEEKADLAGERSGHFFLVDNWYGFDDAIFASLRLIEHITKQDKPLSELIASTPQYVISPTIHVICPDDKKYQVITSLTREFKEEYGLDRVIDINGARVKFDNGWGLVRASSNEPVLVLVFEAKTEEKLKKIKAIFREKLNKYPEVSKEWKNE